MDKINSKTETAKLFFEVNKVLRQCVRRSFDNEELTMPQNSVIGILIKYGEMKISELSQRVSLSNSTVSGIIDRLENQGFVTRTRSKEDRRTVYVKVTDKFQEAHKGFHKRIEENFEEMLSSGTPEQMEKINEGLNTLKAILMVGMNDFKNQADS